MVDPVTQTETVANNELSNVAVRFAPNPGADHQETYEIDFRADSDYIVGSVGTINYKGENTLGVISPQSSDPLTVDIDADEIVDDVTEDILGTDLTVYLMDELPESDDGAMLIP